MQIGRIRADQKVKPRTAESLYLFVINLSVSKT